MSSLSRAERYALSMQAKKEVEESTGVSYEKEVHPEYLTAPKGTPMLFRPMTMNFDKAPKTPFDHRYFSFSFMKDDNGKFFPFKWGFADWKTSPIYEIVKTVAKYDYDTASGEKTYKNEGCDLLLDITKNGDATNKISRGWFPSSTLLMNVIDRMDDWCKENKHSKVLTNRAEHDEDNDRWKTDYGMKTTQFTAMWQLAEQQMGSLVDFDFLTIKHKTPVQVGKEKEYYKTLLAETTIPFIASNYGQNYADAIYQDYNEEEMAYEMYNFDEMPLYKASSIGYFLSKKSQFVKDIDEKYNCNFFEKLTALAEAEKGEEPTENTTSNANTATTEASTEKVDTKPTRGSRVVKTEVVEETKAFDPRTLDPTIFKGISSMTDEELSKIIGVNEDNTLQYVDTVTLEPCDICGVGFDVTGTKCPSCGQSYE